MKKEYIYIGVCPNCGNTQFQTNGIGQPFVINTEIFCSKCRKFFKYNKVNSFGNKNSTKEISIENNKIVKEEISDVRNSL